MLIETQKNRRVCGYESMSQEFFRLKSNDTYEPMELENQLKELRKKVANFAERHELELVRLKYKASLELVRRERVFQAVEAEMMHGEKAFDNALKVMNSLLYPPKPNSRAPSSIPKNDPQPTPHISAPTAIHEQNSTVTSFFASSVSTRFRSDMENKTDPRLRFLYDGSIVFGSKFLRSSIFPNQY